MEKEPRLRFNFRFQAWADVLDWFAKQADLALVLDAPVPGTFNYTDAKEYTPTEAIDLLNGVLLTKGYTLIRRDRMLMVVNLQDGIPEGMAPRVSVDDLSKRGRFEIVSVLLPLGNRNVEEVDKEIAPLLGPHGKCIPLPKTKQLLVTDTAGILQAVAAMIESIPEPQPKKPKPQPPALVVYPVESAEPQVAVEVLTSLLPEAKIVLDAKAAQINVFAVPAHQAVVKSVLEQMQANNPPEKRLRLEVYRLNKSDFARRGGTEGGRRGGRLLETLRVLVPQARITADYKTAKLVVWATPQQHATITATLEKLRPGSSPGDTLQIEVHRLSSVDPADAMALLGKLLPEVQFAVDADSRSLIAIAGPSQQAAIRTTLAELQGDSATLANRQLQVYRLDDLTPASTMELLRTLTPRAELSFDQQTQNLVVLGAISDQKTIRATLDQLRSDQQGAAAAQLLFYPLDQSPPPSLIAGLQQLTPKAKISLEAGGKRLMVVANAADHTKVAAALKRLAENVPLETSRFETYTIDAADATSLLATLGPLLPAAKLSIDPRTNRLLAWATDADHKLLQNAVGRLQDGKLWENTRKLEIYKLHKADPATALGLLQTIVPHAKLSIDAPTRSIIALAVPEDQATIRRTIERLESTQSGPSSPVLRFHELMRMPPPSLITGLTRLYPEAQITLDGKRLMVIASEENHKALKSTIARIEETMPIGEPKKLATYSVTATEKARFNAILPMLTAEMPGLTVVADAEPGVLSIWAKPTQHVLLADIISQLKLDVPHDRKHRFLSYTIASADPAVVLSTLQSLLPHARLSLDPRTRRLLGWCSPDDHEKIKQVLEQMDSGAAEDAQDQLMVYPVPDTNPAVALAVLMQTLPDVQFHSDPAAGTIIARARKSDHKIIAKTLTAMQASQDLGHKQVLEIYPTGDSDPATVLASVRSLVPKAHLVPDPNRGRISAWASSNDQETIRQAVEKLVEAEDAKTAPTVATYRLGRLHPWHTIQMLRSIAPRAQVAIGANSRKIIVWARPADQQRIAQTFERMQTDGTEEGEAKVVVYQLESTPPATAMQMMAQAVPDAIVTRGADARQLVVWAHPSDHEKIKTLVDQLAEGNPAETLETYTLESVTPAVAIPIIQQTVPLAKINAGSDPQQLIVRARSADHEKIAAVIAQLSTKEDPQTAPILKTYTLESVTLAVATPIIQQTVPQAILSGGSDPQQLIARARPADHEKIAAVIAQLSVKEDPQTAPSMAVYALESGNAASLLPILQNAAPRARITVGSEPGQIIAWARPADHEKIKKIIDEIAKSESGTEAAVAVVYKVGAVSAYQVINGLRTIVPNALFTVGAERNQLVAWARPADQAKIKKIVDEMSKKQAGKMVVYTLESTTATAAIRVLTEAFPDTRFAVGTDARQLIVWASDDDQMRLAEAVKQLSQDQLGENAPTAQIYTLKTGSFAATLSSLRTAVPQAKLILGADPRQLTAWARPGDHKKIAQIVEQMTKTRAPLMRVYYFRTADPRAAMTVLTGLVPTAKMAVNMENRSLAVSARPDDHEKIKAAVEQIDREGDAEQALKLEAHRITSADPSKLFAMLRTFFRRRPEIQLSLDDENETVMALATPRDHKKIKALIDEVEKGTSSEVASKVEVYSLKNVDSHALEEVLNKLLEKDLAKVQLSVDSRSDQLVAIARPKHQQIIRETIDRMRTEEQTLEIFQLDVVDPSTATLAIDRLFDSGGYGYDPTAPVVDIDEDSQQLFVSATKEQHEKIRKLLAKMGETNLKTPGPQQQRTIRVVPFHGDTGTMIEEIRRVWPRLRDNPIEIVDADARTKDAVKTEATPEGAKPQAADGDAKKKNEEKKSEKKTDDKSALNAPAGGVTFHLVSVSTEETTDGAKSQAADVDVKTEQKTPVLLILGRNAITVKSDDPRALEQMESLLRSLAPQNAYGRNIGVYPLRNTDAVRIATRLQQVLRDMRPRWQRYQNRTMIVADDRLNAIVVKGNRADRATIESMVRILDAPQSPQSLQAKQPTLIPLKNTEATRVERVVREVFRAQLSPTTRQGSGGRSSRWSPRVSVDSMSNSLIVVADPALFGQIKNLVETLDTAAGDESARGLKIISLQKANASRVQKALEAAMQRSMSRRRRGR